MVLTLAGVGLFVSTAVCAQTARSAYDPSAAGVGTHAQASASSLGAIAVSDSQLNAIRGGFDTGNGLFASFGLQRLVYVNGNLVTETRVNIPDIAHLTRAQASALAAASAVNVVQVGPGNQFDPAVLHQLGGTVIQNSLDNQHIQSITTLDTSVNSLDTFRSLNLQDSLQSAQLNARSGL
ncbi:MAG: hypothetical protein ABI767_10750 [Rhodanobacter sp.]